MSYAALSSFHSPLPTLDALTTTYQLLSVLPLHYLVLCIFIPPSLSVFSNNHAALNFEGGPAQVGMILDWRELGSRRTFDWSPLGEDFLSWRKGVDKQVLLVGLDEGDREAAKQWTMGSVWLGDVDAPGDTPKGKGRPVVIPAQQILRPQQSVIASAIGGSTADVEAQEQMKADLQDATSSAGTAAESNLEQWEWKMTRDPSRGWAIAGAWAVACAADVFLLTTVVRRPKHILDHVVTLHLVHLLLTSWYSSSIPTSLFWWMTMIAHAAACVLWAEKVAIRTEMGKSVGLGLVGSGGVDGDDENANSSRRQGGEAAERQGTSHGVDANATTHPHVLFDHDHDGDEDEEDGANEQTQMLSKTAASMSFSAGSARGKGSSARKSDHNESIPMRNLASSADRPASPSFKRPT
ncbi:unnamed protein product [Parajaminaea phylloscopi]